MQKILFLDHAPYEGGAEVSLKELVKNLDQRRFKSILVCPKDAPYAKELAEIKIPVVNFTYHWTLYKFLLPLIYDCIKLIELIRREKPKIIHTNTRVTNQLGGLMQLVHTLIPKPYTLINHIRDRDPLPWWKLKLINNADLLIANSQKTKEFLITSGIPANKIKVVYNGINLAKFNPKNYNKQSIRLKLNLAENQKVITTIGQIYPRKGISYLIKACKRLTLDETCKLLIAGQDPTSDKKHLTFLKSLIKRLNLKNEVYFLGYRNDIPEILAATDIFALPSLEEPFGRVLIEAMAMELPVVATSVGGIPEIVANGKSGFLVPPQNPQALTEKLLVLLKNDKMRKEFGLTGRKIVEEKFTLQKHVRQIENIYEFKLSTFRHSGVPLQAER